MDQQVSAVDLCPVCKAKEQGRTPPRRKCTCNSGKTVTRAREPVSFNRNQERQSRELHYCCEGLVDHEDPYSKCEAAACLGAECDCKAWRRFESKLYNACRLPGHATRNVSAARDLLTGSAAQSLRERYAASMDEEQRNRLVDACEFGDMELLRCLLDIGSNASDRCIYWPDPEEEQVGVVATPLYIAAAGGKPDVITFLKDQGADLEAPASDGTTPFYIAAKNGHVSVARLLHSYNVDMGTPDQDGTTAVHVAASFGRLEILQFMQGCGANIQAAGSIYLTDYEHLQTSMTPLMIARQVVREWPDSQPHTDVLHYLERVAAASREKRSNSTVPMQDRAARVGVTLKEIPEVLQTQAKAGSAEAKAAVKNIQTHNQQLVSCAEIRANKK